MIATGSILLVGDHLIDQQPSAGTPLSIDEPQSLSGDVAEAPDLHRIPARKNQSLIAIDKSDQSVAARPQPAQEQRAVPVGAAGDRDVEACDIDSTLGKLLQGMQAAHERDFERESGPVGQLGRQRRQRPGRDLRRPAAAASPLALPLAAPNQSDGKLRQNARQAPRRRPVRADQPLAGRAQARSPSALEQHQRRSQLPLIVAQQSPCRTVGNPAVAAAAVSDADAAMARSSGSRRESSGFDPVSPPASRPASGRYSLCKFVHILGAIATRL